jgi:hypothetical protein
LIAKTLIRLRPLAAILLLAGTVCLTIGIIVLDGRWAISRALGPLFMACGLVLALPYAGSRTQRPH